jgi:hypothetical protein
MVTVPSPHAMSNRKRALVAPFFSCALFSLAHCSGAPEPATDSGRDASATDSADSAALDDASAMDSAIDGDLDSAMSRDAATDSADSGSLGDAATTPHVEIRDGRLWIDGRATFLYGGDLHYFRVRARNYDAAQTHAMWAQSLDLMRAAGMNLVTTYIPWDFHNPREGVFDFTGARDVGRFLQMACDRGMYVVAKPGPLITAEWPRGFGTFGAVPAWWKTAHPEALVRDARGNLWTYSPTGAADQRQPSYLHPTYLSAVRDWYQRALAVTRPFLGRCLVALQVDNESNGYWGNRFGDVDYSDVSIAHWRQWLAAKYRTIDALNARYGTTHASFDAVDPPRSGPAVGASDRPRNALYADWYEAGQAYSNEYLRRLRAMMESEGYRSPDVLYFTNDSPFALTAQDLLLRPVLLHDGPTKNSVGLAGLDLYPKQFPTNRNLQDQPFQTDWFTRLYDRYNDQYTGPQDFAYAAELQGGFYAYPAIGQPEVRPAATEQLLARSLGRGLKGGAFYVIRDGLNLDDSAYDYQSAIRADGTTTARYDVMRRWGAFLQREGDRLSTARAVSNSVAILANPRHQPPQAGVLDDMQRLWSNEYPALFGWLARAGIDAEVIDVRQATAAELSRYRVAFYMNPDFIDDATADKLVTYATTTSGVLVNLLWPARTDDAFRPSAAQSRYLALWPANAAGSWSWLNTSRSGTINVRIPSLDAQLESNWYASFWQPVSSGLTVEPFAWERTQPLGRDGAVVGYTVRDGARTRAFYGTNSWARFNKDDLYTLTDSELTAARTMARHLCGLGAERPIVSTTDLRTFAFARRTPTGRLYIFVVNDGNTAGDRTVRLEGTSALGLDRARMYTVRDALDDRAIGSFSGADLADRGVNTTLRAEGATVLTVE